MDFTQRMQQYLQDIEMELDKFSQYPSGIPHQAVFDAMRYSLLGGGKRIRAILTLDFCRSLGGSLDQAMTAACAVEMVHAYSLIHDDLPCMDDDALRRGKPTCHIEYGEAIALLAGDGLLNKAFEIVSEEKYAEQIGFEKITKLVRILSKASGSQGMIGGQTIDIQSENATLTEAELTYLHSLKTGALLSAAVMMGGVLSGCSQSDFASIEAYAQKIGLGFQITDDILDVSGDSQYLGKNIGSDQNNHKTTYVSLLGIEKASALAEKLFLEAEGILSQIKLTDDFLVNLTRMLSKRKN